MKTMTKIANRTLDLLKEELETGSPFAGEWNTARAAGDASKLAALTIEFAERVADAMAEALLANQEVAS